MPKLLEYKCPGCASPVVYDGEARTMKCTVCGSTFAPEDFDEKSVRTQSAQTQQDSIVSIACSSCGGEIICEMGAVTAECPFCCSPVAVSGNISGEYMPKLIVPFKTSKQNAVEALEEYLSHSLVSPGFLKEIRVDEVKGIYLPVWLFDADYYADKSLARSAASVRRYGDTDRDTGYLRCDDYPIVATQAVDDALLDSIAPLDFATARQFDPSYLSGYYLNKFELDEIAAEQLAREDIKRYIGRRMNRGSNRDGSGDPLVIVENNMLAVYPVWLISARWRGRVRTFVVSGDTGAVAGKRPLSLLRALRYFLCTSAAAAAVIAAVVSIVRFMMFI